MSERYVILDTNIFYRYATQGQPGCEPRHWKNLIAAIKTKSIQLLVPEVILLECQKKFGTLVADMTAKISGAIGQVVDALKKGVWNEISDLPDAFKALMENWKQERIEQAVHRSEEVMAFLKSQDVTSIPFTSEVMFRSRKRMLAGHFTSDKRTDDVDCFIIVSLTDYFEGKSGEQLLFCSENRNEFGVETEGVLRLAPVLRPGLPASTQLFVNLATLGDFIANNSTVKEPSSEELEAALREEERKKEQKIEDESRALEMIDAAFNGGSSLRNGERDETGSSMLDVVNRWSLIRNLRRDNELAYISKFLETAFWTRPPDELENIAKMLEERGTARTQGDRLLQIDSAPGMLSRIAIELRRRAEESKDPISAIVEGNHDQEQLKSSAQNLFTHDRCNQ